MDDQSAPEVIRWLREELEATQGDGFSAYTFIYCIFRAFDIELEIAIRVQGWEELGWGGKLSSEDLEIILGRLVPRGRSRYVLSGRVSRA